MNRLAAYMERIKTIVDQVNEPESHALYQFLAERIDYPESFVTMLGETSSGKSTLINGLLNEEILYTGPQPTTGSILEIMDDPSLDSNEYYAVTKEATLKMLSKEQFISSCKQLDDTYDRLRMFIPSFPNGLKRLRLFDTPGYGSIYDAHEEVLRTFIPNSDILIYVINYRVGVNESDHEFVSIIRESLHPDTKFYLVINRVPEQASERRVNEIKNHMKDLLHLDIPIYTVKGIVQNGDDEKVLPKAEKLWQDVKEELNSKERAQLLRRVFLEYQIELLLHIEGHLHKRKATYQSTTAEKQMLAEALEELMSKKSIVVNNVNDTFTKVSDQTIKMIDHSARTMVGDIQSEINDFNRWTSQQECTGYIEAHLMPMSAKREMNNISMYIKHELEKLNEEIESLLNEAVQSFESSITINNDAFEQLILNVGNKIAHKLTNGALSSFFRQYGGAGGAGAGVANASKKALKKIGDLFGKTFSRETHNELAKFLSKIGATSTRAITIAAVVFVESVAYLYNVAVWQGKMNKKVEQSIAKWVEESTPVITKDLSELKDHNIEMIDEFFNEYEKSFTLDELSSNEEDLKRINQQLIQIENLITEIEHEKELVK